MTTAMRNDASGRAKWKPKAGEEVWVRRIVTKINQFYAWTKPKNRFGVDAQQQLLEDVLPVSALATQPQTETLREALVQAAIDMEFLAELMRNATGNEAINRAAEVVNSYATRACAALDAKKPPATPQPNLPTPQGPVGGFGAPSPETSASEPQHIHGEYVSYEDGRIFCECGKPMNCAGQTSSPPPRDEQPSPSELEAIAEEMSRAFACSSNDGSVGEMKGFANSVLPYLETVRREALEAGRAEGRLEQFYRMQTERPADPIYWDKHELEALTQTIRALANERNRT
jgi:hypothetical protein